MRLQASKLPSPLPCFQTALRRTKRKQTYTIEIIKKTALLAEKVTWIIILHNNLQKSSNFSHRLHQILIGPCWDGPSLKSIFLGRPNKKNFFRNYFYYLSCVTQNANGAFRSCGSAAPGGDGFRRYGFSSGSVAALGEIPPNPTRTGGVRTGDFLLETLHGPGIKGGSSI